MLPNLQVIILAAGFSTRLGRPKALTRVHGISLVRRTVVVSASLSCSATIIVTPARARRLQVEVRGLDACVCPNPERARGLSSSVLRGLKQCRYSSAVLLIPVDLVRLKHRELARLVARSRTFRRRVIARRIGGKAATPLILPHWLFASARSIRGDAGLRAFVQGLPADCVTTMALPSAAWDVDAAADLDHARRHRNKTLPAPGTLQ